MAKKIVAQEACLMCGGEGYVLAATTSETTDTEVPCPMCTPARPPKTKKGES